MGSEPEMGVVPRQVLITVHGIRTFGQWQERLAELIRQEDPDLPIENYHYGYFSVLAFLLPPLRWLTTLRFRRHIRQVAERHPGAEISFVAHSFGTHLVGHGIFGMRPNHRPRIDTIILAGSVLRSSFPWGELITAGSVRRVVNDCGTKDNILLLSQIFVLFTGMAGRLGFRGMTSNRYANRYFEGGHSHYFESNDGDHDKFMRQNWVPILVHKGIVHHIDERDAGGPWQGVMLVLLQISDPLKIAGYIGLLLVASYFGFWRHRIAAQESRALAIQAESLRELALARTFYEARSDLAGAVSLLASGISLTESRPLESTHQSLKILSYWMQPLQSIQTAVQRIEQPTAFRWGTSGYVGANGSLYPLDGAYVVAASFVGYDRLFTVDSTDIVRMFNLKNMEVEWQVQMHESDVLASGDTFDEKQYASMRRFLSKNPDKTYGDFYAPTESWEFYFAEDHSPLIVLKPLDLHSVSFDAASGLVVAFGMSRETLVGEPYMAMQAWDPETGEADMVKYEFAADDKDRCGAFQTPNFSVRLRERGEPKTDGPWGSDLIVIDGGENKNVTFQKMRSGHSACEALKVPDQFISDFAFPLVRSERELWSVSTVDSLVGENGAGREGYDEMSPAVGTAELQLDMEYTRIKESVQRSASFSGLVRAWLYADQFERALDLRRVGLSGEFYIAQGKDSSGSGFVVICKMEKLIAKSCWSVPLMGEQAIAVAHSKELIAITSFATESRPSVMVLDLRTMSFIQLPATPKGQAVWPAFDASGRLSVATTGGEAWAYWDLRWEPKSSTVRILSEETVERLSREAESHWLEFLRPIDARQLSILRDGSVVLYDRYSLTPIWLSSPPNLAGTGVVYLVRSRDGTAALFNDSSLRLIDLDTGMFLSDAVQLDAFLPARDEGDQKEPASLRLDGKFSFGPNGQVSVALDSKVLVRERRLSEREIRSRLDTVQSFTGRGRAGEPLGRLPLAGTQLVR